VKMKIVAAAVVSAFAAPAFAQSANVTIYGNLEQHVMSVKGSGGSAPATDFQRRTAVGSPGTNWVGFRGTESLGKGLRVVWQVEQGLTGLDGNVGATASSWGTRNTFIGLSGGFGTVQAGLFDSPYKRVMGVNNVMRFGLTGPMGMNAILNNGDTSGGTTAAGFNGTNAFSRRTSNSITYLSPTFGGFSVEAQYGANENRSNTAGVTPQQDASVLSASLRYSAGPLRAGLGYQKHNDLRVTGGAARDDDSYIVSVGWASGPFNVHGAYTRLNYGTASGDLTRDNWLIGGQYSVGAHRFRAQYQLAQDTKGAVGTNAGTSIGNVRVATLANGLGSDTGADLMSFMYGYALSKRTEVYGFYSRLDNERNGVVNLAGTGALPAGSLTAGMNVTYIGVGIQHAF
jgi:predicted porin